MAFYEHFGVWDTLSLFSFLVQWLYYDRVVGMARVRTTRMCARALPHHPSHLLVLRSNGSFYDLETCQVGLPETKPTRGAGRAFSHES